MRKARFLQIAKLYSMKIDEKMKCSTSSWELATVFAFHKPSHLDAHESPGIQFFDKSGNAVFKAFLTSEGTILLLGCGRNTRA